MSDLSRSLVDAAAAKIGTALHDETGGCHCDLAFSERGRQDPGCVYCQVGGAEFGTDAGRAAVVAVLETLAGETGPLGWWLTQEHIQQLVAEVRGVGEKP